MNENSGPISHNPLFDRGTHTPPVNKTDPNKEGMTSQVTNVRESERPEIVNRFPALGNDSIRPVAGYIHASRNGVDCQNKTTGLIFKEHLEVLKDFRDGLIDYFYEHKGIDIGPETFEFYMEWLHKKMKELRER